MEHPEWRHIISYTGMVYQTVDIGRIYSGTGSKSRSGKKPRWRLELVNLARASNSLAEYRITAEEELSVNGSHVATSSVAINCSFTEYVRTRDSTRQLIHGQLMMVNPILNPGDLTEIVHTYQTMSSSRQNRIKN